MALPNLAADLASILAHAGVDVVYGSSTTQGVLRTEDLPVVDDTGATVNIRRTTVRIRDGVLTGLAVDDTVVVDGTSYRVRDITAKKLDGTRTLTLAAVV